jgi:aryl-alcohol dehydrogenase-like predicted oxidoreductase
MAALTRRGSGAAMPDERMIGDRPVSAIGLGAMPLSTAGRPDRADALDTLRAAIDAGVTLVDTADAYCLDASDTGHNEQLVAEALRLGGGTEVVMVATKGGHVRTSTGGWITDGRPAYLRAACRASARRLGVETIDLYQFHRPDPSVPFADSVGALKELRDDGVVRLVGISNVTVEQLDEARAIVDVAAVQNQLSADFTSSVPELRRCTELGIAFLAWAPLGGRGGAGSIAERHSCVGEVAQRHGVTSQQIVLAWLLSLSPVCIPIPGARRPASVVDSAAAARIPLDDEDCERLAAMLRPSIG